MTDPRSLSITLSWTSPIKPGHQNYRCIKMEAEPDTPMQVLGVQRGRSQPADQTIKRGSVYHEHFQGDSAVAFLNDGNLALKVWCKEDAGVSDGAMVSYGIAVTIEAVFSVNYSFPSTTTISPYERHLPPLATDDIFMELG